MTGFKYSSLNSTRWWFHGLLLTIICALLARYFIAGDYMALPWYDLPDADAPYVAQTTVLLNDGDFYFIYHPGATVYSIQCAVHRVFALVSAEHEDLMRLSEVSNRKDAARLLTTAVDTGRIIALLTIMVLAGTLYLLILKLTKSWLIAFVFTFYVILSQGTLYHIRVIRAESLSVFFFSGAALLAFIGIGRKSLSVLFFSIMFFLSGLVLGMAVFSKIQIGPQTVLLLGGVLAYLCSGRSSFSTISLSYKTVIANLGLAILCVLVTPYWALTRPAFLTPELISTMAGDFKRLYGTAPATFLTPVFAILVLLVGFSIALFRGRSRIDQPWFSRLFAISLTVNLIASGLIMSVYLVPLPASVSFAGYIGNMKQLVYATLTNITGGGFLENAHGAFTDHIAKIVALHGEYSSLAHINVLYIVAVVAFVCAGRLVVPKSRTLAYLVPLGLFAMGFVVDLFSSMRWTKLYFHYAIYSVGFYALGLAYFTWLETKHISILQGFRDALPRLAYSLPGLMVLVAAMFNLWIVSYDVISSPVKSKGYGGSEAAAWGLVGMVPQFKSIMDYAGVRRQVCISPESLAVCLNQIVPVTGAALGSWNLGTKEGLGKLKTVSAAGNKSVRRSEDGYPIFGAASGRVILDGFKLPESIGDLTLGLWARVLEWPRGAGETLLFGTEDYVVGLTAISGRGYRNQIYGYYGGGGGSVNSPPDSMLPSVWRYITLVKSAERLALYIDGAHVAGTKPIVSTVMPGKQDVGINLKNSDTAATFELASVTVWNKALSELQVKQVYDVMQAAKRECSFRGGLRGWLKMTGESRR